MSGLDFDALDEQFDAGKCKEVMEILEKAFEEKQDIEVAWRLSRCQFETATALHPDAQKAGYEKAYNTALKAIDIDSNHYGGYKWAGIALGYLGDFVSKTEMIGNAFKIKEFFENADNLAPQDPTTKHALGKWCYKIASIGFLERTAASALFATPPTSTFEEALEYFLACNDLVQGKLRYVSICSSNYLLLAQTYEGLKDNDKAKEWYKKCLDLKLEGAGAKVQETNKAHAKERFDALNSSWW